MYNAVMLPLWFFGIPVGGFLDARLIQAMSFSAPPSLQMTVAMITVLAGMGLMARRALNY